MFDQLPQHKFFLICSATLLFLTAFLFVSNRYDTSSLGSIKKSLRKRPFIQFRPSPNRHSSDLKETCPQIFGKLFDSVTSGYRQCLLEKLAGKSKWHELYTAIPDCLGGTLWRILQINKLDNQDDTKWVILPEQDRSVPSTSVDRSVNFDCVEVTLGVGKDIEAEKKLQALVPNCRFYGADPILNSGEIFREIGFYYQLAVSSTAGSLNASVLENGNYHRKTVPSVTISDFLTKYTKVDHVDYLFLDAEGAEYGIFEQFQPGRDLGNSNISICQISVEMHGPLSHHKMENRFDGLIAATINTTSFLPICIENANVHMRAFYINTRDKYCVDTFFTRKFCGNV